MKPLGAYGLMDTGAFNVDRKEDDILHAESKIGKQRLKNNLGKNACIYLESIELYQSILMVILGSCNTRRGEALRIIRSTRKYDTYIDTKSPLMGGFAPIRECRIIS